jgi:transporter family protein
MVYILAIVGMVCWGISPIFAKLGLKDINPAVGLSVRAFFTAVALLLWLYISGNLPEIRYISTRSFFLLILEAIVAILIGDLAYFAALKRGSASIVMIIMACSPLVTILLSIILFNEVLTFKIFLGACLTIIGIFLII